MDNNCRYDGCEFKAKVIATVDPGIPEDREYMLLWALEDLVKEKQGLADENAKLRSLVEKLAIALLNNGQIQVPPGTIPVEQRTPHDSDRSSQG